jgi:hypothetical protein
MKSKVVSAVAVSIDDLGSVGYPSVFLNRWYSLEAIYNGVEVVVGCHSACVAALNLRPWLSPETVMDKLAGMRFQRSNRFEKGS